MAILPFASGPAGPSEAPHLRARRVWEEWWERLAAQRAILATLLLVSLVANLAQGVATTVALERGRESVVFVETDRLGHSVVYALDTLAQPSETLVASELARFITAARTVTPDRSLQQRFVKETYARAAQSVEAFLNRFYRSGRDPYRLAASQRVLVEIQSVLPLETATGAGDPLATWQVRWREETRDHGAAAGRVEQWIARIDFVLEPPRDLESALANVAGLHVTGLQWTRESQ